MNTTRSIWLPVLLLCHCVTAQDVGQFSTKNPVQVEGSIGLRSYYSSGSQSPLYRANPFGYALSGNVTIKLFNGLILPFSVAYSNRQTSYTQPFNQFGISPTYKGFTLHAGYRNLRFSDYTLNGFTMLGGGLEVQRGLLRAGFMFGQFNRATSSAEGLPTAFLRTGYATRLGINLRNRNGGPSKSDEPSADFIDLIVLQGRDHAESLIDYAKNGLSPARNTVVGGIINKSFGPHLLFTADAALSIYTGNINAAKIDSTLVPASLPPVLYKSVDPNVSSRGLLAANTSLSYSGKGYGLRLGYQRIDPGFTTMGMYNVNNDLEVYSLAPRFSLAHNKLVVNANLRMQRDNLFNDKLRQTRRFLPTATLSYTPSAQFGISANVNYSTFNQTPGIKQTLLTPGQAVAQLMNQANYTVTVMPRFSVFNDERTHSVLLSVGTNQLVDKSGNADLKANTEFSGLNALLNYSLSFDKTFLSFDAGASYFTLSNLTGTTRNLGLNAGISKGFLNNKLSTNLSGNYNIGEQLTATSLAASARMQPDKHHRFGFTAYQSRSTDTGGMTTRNFAEFRGTLDYTFIFSSTKP